MLFTIQRPSRKASEQSRIHPAGIVGDLYTSRCESSYPHPRLSQLIDPAESQGKLIVSSSYMRVRRTLSLSYANFTAPLIRKGNWSARMCSTRDGLLEPESAESSSLIGFNTFMASHQSLHEVSKSDIAGLENPVETSFSTQEIQIQSESYSTLHPLGFSLISMQGEELEGMKSQVTTTNISELVDSSVETLHENYPLVTGENEDHKYSTLQFGPNGLPLFCTARGCRVAHVSESEYISGSSGIERREAEEDENSKSNRDMYYQSMLETNPGNSHLLSNYAKFLHEIINSYRFHAFDFMNLI